jgi:hypothetical protein
VSSVPTNWSGRRSGGPGAATLASIARFAERGEGGRTGPDPVRRESRGADGGAARGADAGEAPPLGDEGRHRVFPRLRQRRQGRDEHRRRDLAGADAGPPAISTRNARTPQATVGAAQARRRATPGLADHRRWRPRWRSTSLEASSRSHRRAQDRAAAAGGRARGSSTSVTERRREERAPAEPGQAHGVPGPVGPGPAQPGDRIRGVVAPGAAVERLWSRVVPPMATASVANGARSRAGRGTGRAAERRPPAAKTVSDGPVGGGEAGVVPEAPRGPPPPDRPPAGPDAGAARSRATVST